MHGNLAQIVHVIKKISSEATILNAKSWRKNIYKHFIGQEAKILNVSDVLADLRTGTVN